jgi:predicted NAD/FAD-dependent oxidoreductase
MAAGSGASIRLNMRVQELRHEAGSWHVGLLGGNAIEPFDHLILATPAPVSATLLQDSRLDVAFRQALLAALSAATYRPIISVALGFDRPLPALPYYALVNIDRGHAISWLAFEAAKPGYVSAGRAVIVAQMAADWSASRLSWSDAGLAEAAAAATVALAGPELAGHDWWQVERWPLALPNSISDDAALLVGESCGLFFAGDHLVGGRAHLALETGVRAAAALLASH